MKIRCSSSRFREGSVLLIAVCTMLVVGLALLVFLQLGANQNQLVMRSQVWNASLPLAEAGVEDALNHCAWNATNWASSGWTLSNTNTFYRSNTLASGWYRTIIATNTPASNQVTITSTGFYPMPGTTAFIPRTVQATAVKVPQYRFALYGKTIVDFNGNGCKVDSYDSRDPAKSTGGLYDPLKAGDKADIATHNGTPGATYDLGNGNVWGRIFMGPGGKVICGSRGKAGGVAWQLSAVKSGVQPGWFRTDLNISIPDVVLPFTAGVPPLPGIVGGEYYDAIFTSGVYVTPFIKGKAIVTGDAQIYVTGLVDVDMFRLRTNCTVTLYAGGNVMFKDTDNDTQRAANFQLMGLKNCLNIGLDNKFMGAVYAPYATVKLAGSKQVYGSVSANVIQMTGGYDIHFDEALKDPIGRQGYIITAWNEL